MSFGRRPLLLGTLGIVGSACAGAPPLAVSDGSGAAPPPPKPETLDPRFVEDLESSVGGRIGVYADLGDGRTLAHRADERFAMASTFKWVLAAHVLVLADAGELRLEDEVPFGADDLLEYAPVCKGAVETGRLSIAELCEAAVTVSDNTAANLLLDKVGGPAGLTAFVRAHGDDVTRLDRNEPTLNLNEPGDPRDTTSPRAMSELLRRLAFGERLGQGRDQLVDWMVNNKTGGDRLRKGFPPHWTVGDKTGTGQRNAVNDVAFAMAPGRDPIVLAVYTSGSDADMGVLNGVHVAIAERIVSTIA